MKVEDKLRLDEFIMYQLKEEKDRWLEIKMEESRLRHETVLANKINEDKALVDKINGFIEKLEEDDSKTRLLFERK